MHKFMLSAFADEISENFDEQLEGLNALGINYIELRGVNGKNISDLTDDEVLTVKTKLKMHNIKVSAIGSPIGKIKITDDFSSELNKFKHVLEIAKTLNSPYIRMFSFFMPTGDNYDIYELDVLDRWNQYITLANSYNIILLHENEKGIYADTPERCLNLLTKLNSSNVGATFDPANFVQCDVKVYPHAFNMLNPYIKYVHIKDANNKKEVVPAGHGLGKIAEILSELKNSNYIGFVSLEPHLGNFKGYSDLELEADEKKEQSSFKTFKIAYNALIDIINNIGGHYE